ncbi:MAG: type II toxin-antitoxin system VapC family toxin [Dethiobacter sp.]|jgi:PIN domain nuclease of toxin-antitoxin system|nr:type II toxin-antitoxin system VapC family toxin [Dethiobacter sp.]
MMALLDTHVFLWWITDDPRLSEQAGNIISNSENRLFYSAASGWETAIKAGLDKLILKEGNLHDFLYEQMEINDIAPLPVQMNHALHVHRLPLLHRDPFDRMIIAQAQVENMTIVTQDRQIARYYVETAW